MNTKQDYPSFFKKLCPFYFHRGILDQGNPLDRYVYAQERTELPANIVNYGGAHAISLYAINATSDGAENMMPIYRLQKEANGTTYYKLFKNATDGEWKSLDTAPLFWAFTSQVAFSMPFYEHGTQQEESGNRFYYDFALENPYGWEKGNVLCYAITPETFHAYAFQIFYGPKDSIAKSLIEKCGVPGLAGSITAGTFSQTYAFGVRKLGSPELVDENTIFRLASVSKPITSTVIALLVAKGIVSWNDRIVELFKDSSDNPFNRAGDFMKDVTLADLLAHLSGLPAHAGDILEDIGYTRTEIFEKLPLLQPSVRETTFRYTNFGVTLAAVGATLAYNKNQNANLTWEELAHTLLYSPLGMDRTSSSTQEAYKHTNICEGHVRTFVSKDISLQADHWEVSATQRDPQAQSPAGGVFSCAKDLIPWMQLQLYKSSPEQRTAINQTHQPPVSKFAGKGLCWDIKPSGDLSHSGAFLLGTSTQVSLMPSLYLGIVCLSNGQPVGLPEALNGAFSDFVLAPYLNQDPMALTMLRLQLMRQSMSNLYGTDGNIGGRPEGVFKVEDTSRYIGEYINSYYGELMIVDLGSLQLKLPKKTVPLYPISNNIFFFQTYGENQVGLSSLVFETTNIRCGSFKIIYMPFSHNPDYDETQGILEPQLASTFVRKP